DEHWNIAPSTFAELAGVKNTNAVDSTFRADIFENNDSNALWFDQQSNNQVVVDNTIVDNSGHGLAIEVSGNSIVAGNVIAENGRDGLKLSGANAVLAYDNSIVNNGWAQVGVYADPRHSSAPVTLANDILMAGPRSIKAVLNSYDIQQPGALPTLQMLTVDDHNLYGRTNPHRPASLAFVQTSAKVCTTYSNLTAFRSATHRELTSASGDGWPLTKIFVNPNAGNYQVVHDAPLPAPTTLPASVAAALGTSTKVSHIGA
ncbi:MAG TPA: right-handed parallel beta-helix repeat-containing protein, partial [Acidimicrobiia bacterium]